MNLPASDLTILLIEDNPDDAVLVRELLDDQPELTTTIHHCETLSEGIAFAQSNPIDLILLDLSLPDSSGLGTLESLLGRIPDVPLVIMTGQTEGQQGLEAVRRGAQDYIPKSQMDGTLIIRTCRYAVERFRFQRRIDQHNAHLRLLTEQMPALMWTTDRSLHVGSAHGSLTVEGVQSAEELTRMIGLQDHDSKIYRAHQQALSGEMVATDLRIGRRLFHARVEPIRGENEHIVGTVGIAMDVTDHVRLQNDLQLAREIQQALLPSRAPELPGLQIAGHCHFADATGGDFFDYLCANPNRPIVAVGDVSGHGFGPAILTAACHSYLRALNQTPADIVEVVKVVNQLLIEDTRVEQFVTLGLLEFDLTERTVRACQAGHAPAVILDANRREHRTLPADGPPLGWFRDAEFLVSHPVSLQPGMLLLMMTDGVIEARNPAGEVFGTRRTIDFVSAARDLSPEQLVRDLIDLAMKFTERESPQDDMTAVVIKVTE